MELMEALEATATHLNKRREPASNQLKAVYASFSKETKKEAELDNGQDLYSLLGAASRNSTWSSQEIPNHRPRMLQRPVLPLAFAPLSLDHRTQYPAHTVTVGNRSVPLYTLLMPRDGSLLSSFRRDVSITIPDSGAHFPQTRGDASVPQFSSDVQSYRSNGAQSMEAHLQAYWNGSSPNASTPTSEPDTNRYDHQLQNAELEDTPSPLSIAQSASSQAVNMHINHGYAIPANTLASNRSDTSSRRFQVLGMRRLRSTSFAYGSHTISTSPKTVPPASITEQPVGLRSRAMPDVPQSWLSRMVSISSLQELVARDRTRRTESTQSLLRPQRS
jgi:hypothetical protein